MVGKGSKTGSTPLATNECDRKCVKKKVIKNQQKKDCAKYLKGRKGDQRG